jgi:hypothetical protein
MPLFAKPEPDNPKARYEIRFCASGRPSLFTSTSRTTVRGDAALRSTRQAIREAGGHVVKVRQLGRWFG